MSYTENEPVLMSEAPIQDRVDIANEHCLEENELYEKYADSLYSELETRLQELLAEYNNLRALLYKMTIVQDYCFILYFDAQKNEPALTLVPKGELEPVQDIAKLPFSVLQKYYEHRKILEMFKNDELSLRELCHVVVGTLP